MDILYTYQHEFERLESIFHEYLDNLSKVHKFEIKDDEKSETPIPKNVDIKNMHVEMNLLKLYEKLEKIDCLEPEIFWKLDEK